ncbi:MAG TPA: FtsX-like permease family protein, partial [Actinomycetota bacterium]
IGSLFLFIGSFAIIAGVLLLVNVFVMLAEERKGELGMLRAVGMRRGRLVRGFVIEGAVYSLVAAAAGLAAGLGVGRAVVAVTARIFAGFSPEEGGLDLAFTATPTSLVNGFAAGFLIGFVTVALTSIRISRINIIAAIRDLPAAGGRRLRWRWVLASTLAAAGIGAAAVVAVAGSQGVGTYLYPPLALLALCPLLVRVLPRRVVYTGASLAVLGWGLAANTLRPKVFDDGSTATFIVLGVVLTFSAVLLVSQNQELLLRLLRPLLARPSASGLAARLAVAYPTARRFRTGATLIMYGLVVFTLVLITVLGTLIDASMDRAVAAASGGYALRVDYNPSAPIADPQARLAGGRFAGRVAGVAPLTSAKAQVLGVPGAIKPLPTTVVGATPALADHGLFPLEERLGRLGGDDRAVWRAVLANPGYVVLDQYLGQEGAGMGAVTYRPGDTLTVADPASGRRARKVIAGILTDSTAFDRVGDGDFASPVVMATAGVRDQFGPRARPEAALLAVAPGTSDQALAADLQGEFLPQGLVATRIGHLVEQDFAANRSFFHLLQGFLALGLVVGVAGLGVVMVRAVRERRRTVGVLRALGFPARVVRRAFLLESSFVALEGILLGTALSLATSYLLFRNDDDLQGAGTSFPIPWLSISLLVAATAAASLAATAWPARQAARIDPAVALRLAD